MQLSIENLATLGFFFTMISFEHVKATKIDRNKYMIRLQNMEFWLVNHEKIELSDPGTFQAQVVYLTF